jgi:hypothetical protein
MKQFLRLQIPNVTARIRLNYLTSFVFLFFVHLSARAQPVTIWEKTLDQAMPIEIIQTTDGGYAVLADQNLSSFPKRVQPSGQGHLQMSCARWNKPPTAGIYLVAPPMLRLVAIKVKIQRAHQSGATFPMIIG